MKSREISPTKMAPNWPEEIDVFSVPHLRMKKLVHKYSDMITTTDFRDELHLRTLLKNLMNVFTEFKAHEQIENILIMKKLKSKLKAASVTNAAVCNCHSDNRLTDMLGLVEDGYRWTHRTEQERQMYGKKLRNAVEVFTENFIPHMEEEEEVFQPMLMQYFTYEELKELKAKVIYQHDISKQHEEYHHEKFVEDLFVSDDVCDPSADSECHFSKLPMEICLQIFSMLGPRDLARTGQVSQKFLHLSRDPCLWSRLHPVHWAQGNWSFKPEVLGGVDGQGLPPAVLSKEDEPEAYFCVDEDADIDESRDSDGTESLGADGLKQIVKEARMLTAMVKYLLPQVGSGVKVCDLAFSKGLSSSLVHRVLKQCPNLEVLDLTHTSVGDIAFKEFGVSSRQSKLRHLDLTGCENITDMTLISLASLGRRSWSLSKDDRNVEIENIPRPCAQRLRACCGESTPCISHQSDVPSHNFVQEQTAMRDCDPAAIETCRGPSGVSHAPEQPKGSPFMLQLMNVDYNDSSVSMEKESPQTYDVNFVCMNLLPEPGETLSSSHVDLVNSFTNAFSDISLTRLSCDNILVADPLSRGSSSCLTHRGAGGILKAISQTQSIGSLNVSTTDHSVPSEHDPIRHSCKTSANHIGSPYSDTDGSTSSLEFLSLNGCYRISDVGLRALADGEGTPRLHHLDLSGCVAVTALGLTMLVSTSQRLDHSNLYYCDNMSDDPYFSTASGCRNLESETRFCCCARE